jgi:ribosomal protein S27AE
MLILKTDTRQANWRRANPAKYDAHLAVQRAVKAGDLAKQTCEVCGAVSVDAHHDQYDDPLLVRWLCRRHQPGSSTMERTCFLSEASPRFDTAHLVALRQKGFRLGRPEVDTLEGSRHSNMKELRVKVLKVQWRFAFAFDPERKAVVLCGGAKSGVSQKLFYKRLIDLADRRYDDHLQELEKHRGRS